MSTASERTTSTTYQSSSSSYTSSSKDSSQAHNATSSHQHQHQHHHHSLGYWDSSLSITQRVVTEIIETERTYVDDLEQIVTGYICFLRNVLKQQKQTHIRSAKLSKQTTNPSIIRPQSLSSESQIAINKLRHVDEDDVKSLIDDDVTSAINGEEEDYDDVQETDDTIDHLIVKNISIESDIRLGQRRHSLPTKKELGRESTTDGPIITANHIKRLFSNLEDIHKFNKDFLFRLEECYLNPSSVAECFVENSAGFEVYTHYCTAYPQVVSTLTELMANPTSAQLLRERQEELNQSLPLGAYLLKPVQRILKYHILFDSLITHTANDDSVTEKDSQLIREAFSVMSGIASHINDMKRKHEHAIRVQEVQGILSGWRVSNFIVYWITNAI